MKTVFYNLLRYVSVLLMLLGTPTAVSLYGQTPADSAMLVNAPWKIVETTDGLTIKKADIRLFDSDQQIYCVEFNPRMHSLRLKQQENRETVKRLGKQEVAAEVAVNGGFFVTKTNKAIANDFTKIDGEILTAGGGWGNAAFALDSVGRLCFINNVPGLTASDSLWHLTYSDVMTAGPMLIYDSSQLIPLDHGDTKRHPRTIIGMRPDHTVVMMVIDGRQKGADGMSPAEMAWSCRILGMNYALNLDGGGSSALWSRRNKIINRPSDKIAFIRIPRKVGNALIVEPANAR